MAQVPENPKKFMREYSKAESIQKMETEEEPGDVFLDAGNEFTDLQLEDYTWKVVSRKFYGRVLLMLLLVQNVIVFSLVAIALVTDRIESLQLIFSVLVAATLTETAYMVKVIVEWLFKDINYPSE